MKRARTEGGTAMYEKALRTNAYLAAKYPLREYGRMFVPKGTVLQEAGASWKKATQAQKDWRAASNYHGVGKYTRAKRGLVKFAKKNKLGQRAMTYGIQAAKSYAGMGMYTGRGAYSLSTNDLIQGGRDSTASFRSVGDETGDIIISHTEYVGDIYGNSLKPDGTPVPFESTIFQLNPGLEKLFPWLSQIANNYQEYEFQQLVFQYRPTLAEVNSNNGQVGEILVATQYDPKALPFAGKSDIMRYPHHVQCRTLDALDAGVECDPDKLALRKKRLYVRNQTLSAGDDINDYDYGFAQFSVFNTPASIAEASLGALQVYYTVRLSKPIVHSTRGLDISRSIATTAVNGTSVLPSAMPQVLFQGVRNNLAIQPLITSEIINYVSSADVTSIPISGPKVGKIWSDFINQLYDDATVTNSGGSSVKNPNPMGPLYGSDENAYSVIISGAPTASYYNPKITFPANYFGNVKITVVLENAYAPIMNADLPTIKSMDAVFLALDCKGSVSPLYDISQTFLVTGKANVSTSTIRTPIRTSIAARCSPLAYRSGTSMVMEAHVHIAQAADRTDNSVILYPSFMRPDNWDDSTGATQPGCQLRLWAPYLGNNVRISCMSVDCTEYNPSFGEGLDPEELYKGRYEKIGNIYDVE